MKRISIIVFAIFIIGLLWYYRTHPLVSKVRIRGTIIKVEVAATEAQKQKGLGNRTHLPQDSGMLFPYDHKEQYNFWMKAMQFPLDFIWIDDKTVADITRNVPPKQGNTIPIVTPAVPVDTVLEVNAGVVDQLGIQIGDTVEFLDR
jgi:uncharacterized membrane protein (UPF0127 family)